MKHRQISGEELLETNIDTKLMYQNSEPFNWYAPVVFSLANLI